MIPGKLIARFTLFFSPLIFWYALEVFILPVDFFTFRISEALLIYRKSILLPMDGYYPNQHIWKNEFGDMDPQRTTPKFNEWITDQFGERNRPRPDDFHYDMVLVGASNIWGSSLSQNQMLGERIMAKMNITAYTLSASAFGMPGFLRSERFSRLRPKYVLWGVKNTNLKNFLEIHNDIYGKDFLSRLDPEIKPKPNPAWFKLGIYIDRILKNSMWRSLRAKLRVSGSTQGEVALSKMPDKTPAQDNKDNLELVRAFNAKLAERGIRLIMVILPSSAKAYDSLCQMLNNARITCIDYAGSKKSPRFDMSNFWQKLDTHWTPEAVDYTADLVVEAIQKLENNASQ